MASCRGEHLNRNRSGAVNRRGSGTLEYRRQVADHATGPLGQSQLDRPVQILDSITEPAGNLKDHYLTYGVLPGPRTRGPVAGRPVDFAGSSVGMQGVGNGTTWRSTSAGRSGRLLSCSYHVKLNSVTLKHGPPRFGSGTRISQRHQGPEQRNT